MTVRPRVLVATSNRGKAREFEHLIPFDVEIVTLADLGIDSPDETGTTFEENATLKALNAARRSGLVTIADDSGLCVDALDGAPGLYSARFAGPDAVDGSNRTKLLDALKDVPPLQRGAHFIAVVVVALNNDIVAVGTGQVDGKIGLYERGDGGFGYDPLFVLPDSRTMAELTENEKNIVSHRARATMSILPALGKALGIESRETTSEP